MLRYGGNPAQPYGFGRYGGIDETQWCPAPPSSLAFATILIPGRPPWVAQSAAPLVFVPVDPTQPIVPCDEPHEAP